MKGKITHIIYGSLIGLLFILVGIDLALARDCDTLSFSWEKVGDIIGIFVSTIGILITAYFVVLAINAYSHIKDIQSIKKEIDGYAQGIKEDFENFQIQKKDLLREQAQSLFNGLDTQIALAELSKSVKLRNMLVLEQARLACRYPMLDKQIRLTLLRKLADIGEVKDIYNIEIIIYNPDEDTEIKKQSELVLEELKRKFGIS